MGACVHQGVDIGPGAMVGMSSAVRKEVAPWAVTIGNPARAVSLNTVGLSRLGCDEAAIESLRGYLAGTADLPQGLPVEVTELLTAWSQREASAH
jgi:UDP-N-acetylglucosamine acyltransferase